MAVDRDVTLALQDVMADSHGRLLSALIANLRDFQLAEDSLQDALASAMEHWARVGVPRNPPGWLLQTARRKAIDRLRRDKNFNLKSEQYGLLLKLDQADAAQAPEEIPDERLRLIFTCCHPALDPKTRVALTLRTLGGLTTGEIARAFLDREPAMAQRLVRAKRKIAKAGLPFQVPAGEAWAERLNSVLKVIYLIFNEGYVATRGDRHIRVDLCEEAIYLARMVDQLRPEQAEVEGLLALMLLIHARREARALRDGTMIALEDQDRALWQRAEIAEGVALVERGLKRGQPGPYQIQAAIQAVHAEAADFNGTGWREIAGLYDALLQYEATPVILLNRAVALSFVAGPEQALQALEPLQEHLADYQPFHAARAEFLYRSGAFTQADAAYARALALCENDSAAGFLIKRRARAQREGSTKKEAEQSSAFSPTGR